MVNRMRSTTSHTGNRRSHHALKAVTFGLCKDCGQPKAPHTVCANCGKYKGKEVINVLAKQQKRAKKNAVAAK